MRSGAAAAPRAQATVAGAAGPPGRKYHLQLNEVSDVFLRDGQHPAPSLAAAAALLRDVDRRQPEIGSGASRRLGHSKPQVRMVEKDTVLNFGRSSRPQRAARD